MYLNKFKTYPFLFLKEEDKEQEVRGVGGQSIRRGPEYSEKPRTINPQMKQISPFLRPAHSFLYNITEMWNRKCFGSIALLLLSLVLRSSKLISPQFPSLLLSFPEIKLCWVFCYDVNFQQDNDFPSSVFPNSWHNICFENMMPSILVPTSPLPQCLCKSFPDKRSMQSWLLFLYLEGPTQFCGHKFRQRYLQKGETSILKLHPTPYMANHTNDSFWEKKSYQRWR